MVKVCGNEIDKYLSDQRKTNDTGITITAQLALRRWPNVGPTSTLTLDNVGSPTLGQRGFVNWPNIGPTVARQRWSNVVPTSAH